MSEYFQILQLILPVFVMLMIGMVLRWRKWMEPAVERGMVVLVVKVFYPCLVIKSMIQADSFRESPDSLWAPVAGFGTVTVGFVVARLVGGAFGMKPGGGLRTFAFSAGIYNYGYLPIPLMENMFGPNELAVLFVHNVGIEVAIWTVGVSFLAGSSMLDGLKKVFNPMVIALIIGLSLNLLGVASSLPSLATSTLYLLAGCAVPLGLLAIGASFYDNLQAGERIWDFRDCSLGVALRLGLLPLLGLGLACCLPLSMELKRVLVIQAAMPAGIMPIVLAKHYGGQSIVAVRVAFASTVFGLITMPLWIRFGLELIGS
ncbi:transporter, AEC family [Verrucomicrobiia bacterium DG1235]|nr:transporter, AEC family [Verrucomicrobiae bacterium DG1235]